MQQQVYHSRDIQAWEQRWFSKQNSVYGLMQQVAWSIAQRLDQKLQSELHLTSFPKTHFSKPSLQRIAVWCGMGNNAGDGYCLASYLKQLGYHVEIFAQPIGNSQELKLAMEYAQHNSVMIHQGFNVNQSFDCHVDALFGIGLNRNLDKNWQEMIQKFNQQSGLKVCIDMPSGLHADTGQPLPCAIQAHHTFTVLGLKVGLFTGQGKEYAGQVELISLIPKDQELEAVAQLSPIQVQLPLRQAFGHKGSYGHVLVIGGHENMGGAVMMSAESAFSAGAGKVTVLCHEKHHTAILSRSPNIMIRDIDAISENEIDELLNQVNAVCFGMGLGRDHWAEQQYLQWFSRMKTFDHLTVILDADALWFLAIYPEKLKQDVIATPHPGEAAKLLNCSINEVESDRVNAIDQLQQKYSGQWVLKGAGSLILEDELWICTAGNAGMATGGMGDVLAGMIASLKTQFKNEIKLHEMVTLHALAGDLLAEQGMRGLQAYEMSKAIQTVVNGD